MAIESPVAIQPFPYRWRPLFHAAAGGTFLGLATLLTDARGFDEVLDLCATGHSQKVDMLVSDIYAADYEKIGLKGSVIASSFGKARRSQARDDIKQVRASIGPMWLVEM
jgi:pantothenate kinase